jgi:pathogenesis-related protein 1
MLRRAVAVIGFLSTLTLVACSSDDSGGGGGGAGGGGNSGDTEPAAMTGMTAAHNAARANVNPPAASPIPPLAWSSAVAKVAQAYADKCVFQHSGGSYGENLYANTGGANPDKVVSSWVSEVADYDYATNSCSAKCGHYTQVVWADSTKLGCGVANCTTNSPFGSSATWQLWVCNYDPPGNWVGEKPY